MRRFIKQTLLVLATVLVILSALDLYYTWVISERPAYGIGKNQKVDWLIIGDSRSVSLRAPFMSYVTGKKVLNIASPFYTFDNSIELLDYFFKNGNTVDKVLLQVDQKFGSRRGVMRNFEYFPHIIRQRGLLSPRFPFKYYAENNRNIRPTQIVRYTKDVLTGRNKVVETMDTTWFKINHFKTNPNIMMDHSMDEFRIEDIKALRENLLGKGVKEVILYSPPYYKEWIYLQADSASFKEKVRNAGFKYYDISNIYTDTSYFIDHLHVKNRKYWEYGRLVNSIIFKQH
jgi:hypothetical protein